MNNGHLVNSLYGRSQQNNGQLILRAPFIERAQSNTENKKVTKVEAVFEKR